MSGCHTLFLPLFLSTPGSPCRRVPRNEDGVGPGSHCLDEPHTETISDILFKPRTKIVNKERENGVTLTVYVVMKVLYKNVYVN